MAQTHFWGSPWNSVLGLPNSTIVHAPVFVRKIHRKKGLDSVNIGRLCGIPELGRPPKQPLTLPLRPQ